VHGESPGEDVDMSLPIISPEIREAIEAFERAVTKLAVEQEISTRESDIEECEGELEQKRYTLYERIKKHSV
jgi:predicted  nucleic acid-binding Zn-ribbon protein